MENLRNNLGKTGTDIITGFSGIITAAACYITGCDQYSLTAEVKDNYTEGRQGWFDVNRIEISDKVVVEIETEKEKGAMESPNKG